MRPLRQPLDEPHVLVVRLDGPDAVIASGPAIRAVAAGARRVTLLCGPEGEEAAELLPDVDRVVVYRAAWIDPAPAPLDWYATMELVGEIGGLAVDQALVLTAPGHSPLPTALLLRLAGVPAIAGLTDEHAGALLDIRLDGRDVRDERERGLLLASALGYALPADDDGAPRLNGAAVPSAGRYVVLQPPHHGAVAESSAIAEAVRRAGWAVVDVGEERVAALAQALSGADALLSTDERAAQVAAALGKPTILLDGAAPDELVARLEHGTAGAGRRG